MSKLSFRAKPLEEWKPMSVYINEDLPGLPDYTAINRAVPQMPSGMFEEEECEHHLQRAIRTGLIIPTPECTDVSNGLSYDRLYPPDFKLSPQLVHMQSFAMDQDIPDYDMDSEDEMWFRSQKSKLEITPLKFEEMMDQLEKGSVQTVLTEQQAKALLKDDDGIILAVYEYWLNKRLRMQHPLIPSVRTELYPGSAHNNPYVAFIRQTEEKDTRKHRKNNETSYEKMLKLKRDFNRAVTLLEMIKRREKTKREVLHLTVEIFEKRYQAGDYSGQLLAELSTVKMCQRPAFAPLFPNQFSANHQNWPPKGVNEKKVLSINDLKDEGVNLSKYQFISHELLPVLKLPRRRFSMAQDQHVELGRVKVYEEITEDVQDEPPRKEKRQYKKRKHKVPMGVGSGVSGTAGLGRRTSVSSASLSSGAGFTSAVGADSMEIDGLSSDEGDSTGLLSGVAISDDEDSGADASEGPFAFRRRKNCSYHAPLPPGQGNWPWCSREEGGLADRRYRFCLTSIATPPPGRCVGFARRRVGRGGRIILDRAHTPMDDVFRSLDFTILDSKDKQKVQQRSSTKQLKQPQLRKILYENSPLKRALSVSGDNRTSFSVSQTRPAGYLDAKFEIPLVKQRKLEHSGAPQTSDVHHVQTKLEFPLDDTNVFREQSSHQVHNKEQSSWLRILEDDQQKYKTSSHLSQDEIKSRGQECGNQDSRTSSWFSSSGELKPSRQKIQSPLHNSQVQQSSSLQLLEEQKPLPLELWDYQETDEDLLAEIRSEWLHFRPETQSVTDLGALRFDIQAPSGSPTEMSVLDILCNMPGNILDTSDVESPNRLGTYSSEVYREDAATQTVRQITPHQAHSDHRGSVNLNKIQEPIVIDDDVIGCSHFNVYPGSGTPKTSPPQTWASVSTTSHPAPGPGRPLAISSTPRTSHHHKKQDRHHQVHQTYSLHNSSGSNSSANNPQPLSNGMSIMPVSVSAVLSANAGLLRQGLSNGPAGSLNTVRSPTARRRAVPVKQDIMEDPVDGSNETFNCVNYVGGAGSSPGEGVASGLRTSTGNGDTGTATSACGEQQKLKSSTASQQHVLMEVT